MDRLSVWLNTRPKQSVCSSILSKGSTFSLEKPPKSWNMVYYCMTGFSKCVRLMNVLRIELLFEKQCPLCAFFFFFFQVLERNACKLLLDLSSCNMNYADAFGVPKHLVVITFNMHFFSCAHATVAVTLQYIKKCSRVFIIPQVPPPAAQHCHVQSVGFIRKHAHCVAHPRVHLELM